MQTDNTEFDAVRYYREMDNIHQPGGNWAVNRTSISVEARATDFVRL